MILVDCIIDFFINIVFIIFSLFNLNILKEFFIEL